jgi:hypothetical protein
VAEAAAAAAAVGGDRLQRQRAFGKENHKGVDIVVAV